MSAKGKSETQIMAEIWSSDREKLQAEINALKAELGELKAPPKVLRAEEVTEVGYYWHKSGKEWEIVEYYPCSGFEFPDFGQFIGPIQMSEV